MSTSATPEIPVRRRPWLRWVVGLLVLALLLSGAVYGWLWYRDRSERAEAERLFNTTEFSRAEPYLRRYAERHPNDLAIVRDLARGYLATERLNEADQYFAQWCALEPNSPQPFQERIKLWQHLGRLNEMAEDGKRVLERDPNNKEIRLHLPDWLFRLGKIDEAERECQRGLQVLPGNRWLRLLLADIARRHGHADRAVLQLDQLIQEYPQFAEAILLRGTICREAGQQEQARDWLQRAVQLDGLHRPRALYELSLVLAQLGKKEEAERALAESNALEVRTAALMLQSGKTVEANNAVTLLNKVLARDPSCAEAHKLLAAYYEKEGQPERAAEHRRQAGP